MIEITVSEVFSREGEVSDRYSLTNDPSVTATARSNALNKLCRKLVKIGLSGPAHVSGEDEKARLLVLDIAKVAAVDLRESDERGFYVEPYREFPGVLRVAV